MSNVLLNEILSTAGLAPADDSVSIVGEDPIFPVPFRVADAGAASIAASAIAAAEMWRLRTGRAQSIRVDVDAAAASLRSYQYMRRPESTEPPGATYRTQGGNIFPVRNGRWVYLHREFAHHRARIAALLGCAEDPESTAKAAAGWDAAELEEAVFAAGACAGMVRSHAEWNAGPQAPAIAKLPLLDIVKIGDSPPEPPKPGTRPLSGIRVLDLTRVLAGPTGARTLAEHGAEVLRIGTDLLPTNEMQLIDTGYGKRSAVLDLTQPAGVEQLRTLVRGADVFSQGYRPGSLAARGFSPEALAALRPGIVYVSLCAFSHEGPWSSRRGFDTLVQTVSGIADEYALDGRPRMIPVSALDYITGYLIAFGVIAALGRRAREGGSYNVRISLAQTGRWLTGLGRVNPARMAAAPRDLPLERIAALTIASETPYGRLTHLAPIAQMSETPARWDHPAVPLDHDKPVWLA